MTKAKGTPKRYFQKPDDGAEPKKQTILLYPKDIEMLDALMSKYKLNKSGTLQDVAVRILERLDRRRKPPHQIEFYELDPSFVHLPSEEGGKSH